MEIFNVIGLGGHFTLHSSQEEEQRSVTVSLHKPEEIAEQLLELLTHIPHGSKADIILDERWIQYHTLTLPLFSRSRILKLLRFELSQILFSNIEEYMYIPSLTFNKGTRETYVSVYSMRHELLEVLREAMHDSKLDNCRIIPLSSAISTYLKDQYSPNNHIVVCSFLGQLRVFSFVQGVVKDISLIPLLTSADSGESNWLLSLNQRIASFLSHGQADSEVSVYGLNGLEVVNNVVEQKGDFSALAFETAGKEIINSSSLLSNHVVNMQERTTMVLQLLAKHKTRLIKLAVALSIIVVLYAGVTVYKNILIDRRVAQAEKIYTQVMRRYLPGSVSIDESIPFLQRALKRLDVSKVKRKNIFFSGTFPVSNLWQIFAKLQEKQPGLQLTSIVQEKSKLEILGKIEKVESVKQIQNELLKHFPSKQYRLSMTNKKRKTYYLFTITISVKKKSE